MIQTAILLSDPEISAAELAAVGTVLQSPWLSGGPEVAEFETAFAQYTGREYAVAVSSGTLGMLLTLKA
jgi:perosamine synthetase